MHPIYSIPMFITGSGVLAFGVLTLFKNPSGLNKLFFLLCASVAAWALFFGAAYTQKEGAKAFFFFKVGFIGVVFIGTFFYHFVCRFLGLNRRWLIRTNYLLSTVFLFLIPTQSFLAGYYLYFWGYFPKSGGWLYNLFVAFFYACFFGCLIEVLRVYLKIPNVPEQKHFRNRVKYMLASLAVASLSVSDYLGNYGIEVYPFAYLAATGWLILIAHGTLKYKVIDINIIIRKTVVYSIMTAALSAVYVTTVTLLAWTAGGWMGSSTLLSSIIAACIITLLFHPLLWRVQKIAERYIFTETLDEKLFGEFAGGFVHEMKGPLTNISLPAQVTLLDLKDVRDGKRSLDEVLPKIEQRLKYIIDQSTDTSYKIEAIREVSRLAQDQSPEERVELPAVFEVSLSELEKILAEVRVRLDLPASLPPVRGHAKRFQIVFTNLIKNAAEAMKQASSVDRTITIQGQEEDPMVLITIRDSGPGITADEISHLFEPYYSTKGARGMGIGLYLSQRIIKAAGGLIEVKSKEGDGAEFIVRLRRFS